VACLRPEAYNGERLDPDSPIVIITVNRPDRDRQTLLSLGIYSARCFLWAILNIEGWPIVSLSSLETLHVLFFTDSAKEAIPIFRAHPVLWRSLRYQSFAALPYLGETSKGKRETELARLRRVAISVRGSLCARAFPNLLGTRVADSVETEGNWEFCALNAPRGLPRYQVPLFPLSVAPELLRIKRCYRVPRD